MRFRPPRPRPRRFPHVNKNGLNRSEEQVLSILCGLKTKIVSQAKIGRYTVDFLLPDQKAIVEVDGEPYHSRPEDTRRAEARDRFLQSEGYLTIHVWTSTLHEEGGPGKVMAHVRTRLYLDRGIVLRNSNDRTVLKFYRKLGYDPDSITQPAPVSGQAPTPSVIPPSAKSQSVARVPSLRTALSEQKVEVSETEQHS